MLDTVTTPPTDWPKFIQDFRWKQGEHVAMIGPSGVGKSTVMTRIMPFRKTGIFFANKRTDPLYSYMVRHLGFVRYASMNGVSSFHDRILLQPKHLDTIRDTYANQENVFREAFDKIAKMGKWTAYLDEAKYMSQMLGLSREVTFLMEQLRADKGTIIAGAQRPSWLSPSVLSNTTHAFLWKSTNRDDAIRLSDMGGIDARAVRDELVTLDHHEFLYIRTRGSDVKIVRTQVRA